MSSSSYRKKIVDEVTEKVTQRSRVAADERVVRAKATEVVDELADAPIQAYTALLAENSVLRDLRATREER